ncbi:hypothetical protein GL279_01235 [Paracoccus limosus]|jgi:hypothetical protein|uniref:Uncharacterized protein n=1 Tax=Paracoccus limosus TaxID=913252 RepID=A0A844GWZ8_9RHOB|nr:hypothetical protein [Paracoccus limosus]MTH33216.1 hypothetical protein [Paracoccus limosus]
MNLNQLFAKLSRLFGQRLLNRGADVALHKRNIDSDGKQSPQQRQREKAGRAAAKRARQAARITRRMR